MNIRDNIPSFLYEIDELNKVYNIQQMQCDKLQKAVSDMYSQCFVDTADWGLKYWEEFLGLPVNKSKETKHRREVINAKLQGSGTVTKDMIEHISYNFSSSEVEVKELPKDKKFIIKFVGKRGVPPNIDDLTQTINDIKPAHLAFEYEYTYSLWGWAVKYEWSELEKFTWEEALVEIEERASA